jgi:hypothetical protein
MPVLDYAQLYETEFRRARLRRAWTGLVRIVRDLIG